MAQPQHERIVDVRSRLLAQLPPDVLSRLNRHLEPVHLERQQVLFRAHEPPGFAYFPEGAVVAHVATLESGESLAVGVVGSDGVFGLPIVPDLMCCDGIVLITGPALRLGVDVLQAEAATDARLSDTLQHFAQLRLLRCMQLSVCNTFHSVEKRCARWLLTLSELIADPDIPLTHELMAIILGVHRPTLTLVLRSLHRMGAIAEGRGHIRIRDRQQLEAVTCECYRLMRDEQSRLLEY